MEDLPVDLKRRGKFPDPQPDAPFPEIALEKQDAEADALAYDQCRPPRPEIPMRRPKMSTGSRIMFKIPPVVIPAMA